jgi:hypothetical protein
MYILTYVKRSNNTYILGPSFILFVFFFWTLQGGWGQGQLPYHYWPMICNTATIKTLNLCVAFLRFCTRLTKASLSTATLNDATCYDVSEMIGTFISFVLSMIEYIEHKTGSCHNCYQSYGQ